MRIFLPLVLYALSVTGARYAYAQAPARQTTGTAVDILAGDILKASKNPGGIELISGCDVPVAKDVPSKSENIDITLAAMAQKEGHLTWTKSGMAYTVTIQLAQSRSVTSVKLPALQMKVKTLSEATDTLLQAPAVRDRIADTKMTEVAEKFGFTSLNEGKTHNIDLPAGTLREDLNLLATTFGAAIWKLDQRECGNSRTIRISWIAK
jgi:hypothetical protein